MRGAKGVPPRESFAAAPLRDKASSFNRGRRTIVPVARMKLFEGRPPDSAFTLCCLILTKNMFNCLRAEFDAFAQFSKAAGDRLEAGLGGVGENLGKIPIRMSPYAEVIPEVVPQPFSPCLSPCRSFWMKVGEMFGCLAASAHSPAEPPAFVCFVVKVTPDSDSSVTTTLGKF